jgi:predicted Holliday junction resolvase-like endonuclease
MIHSYIALQFDAMTLFLAIVLVLTAGVLIRAIAVAFDTERQSRLAERRKKIYEKYGPTATAERLINKTLWAGESFQQLLDSLGKPEEIDEKIQAARPRSIWKYESRGGDRHRLRITMENGFVVGWDKGF